MKLASHDPRLDDACRRTELLANTKVVGAIELDVRPTLANLAQDLGDAAFDTVNNAITVDVDAFCSRDPALQEAVLLHEIGHALVAARLRGDQVAFGIDPKLIDQLSEEVIADLFACVCGRAAEIATVQRRFGGEYVKCLEQWRDPDAFARSAQAYIAAAIARRMRQP